MVQYIMKYMHCIKGAIQLNCITNGNRMLTCFRARICHSAAEGKTSLPARKAA